MAAPVAITDKKRFAEFLERAMSRTREIAADVPQWPAGAMLLPQLAFMKDGVATGITPTDEELERINVGVLALREVEETDAELAGWLMELDYAYRRYGQLP